MVPMGFPPFCQATDLDFLLKLLCRGPYVALHSPSGIPQSEERLQISTKTGRIVGAKKEERLVNSCCPDSIDLLTANSPTLSQSAAFKGFILYVILFFFFLSSPATVGGPHFWRKVALLTANQSAIKAKRQMAKNRGTSAGHIPKFACTETKKMCIANIKLIRLNNLYNFLI